MSHTYTSFQDKFEGVFILSQLLQALSTYTIEIDKRPHNSFVGL